MMRIEICTRSASGSWRRSTPSISPHTRTVRPSSSRQSSGEPCTEGNGRPQHLELGTRRRYQKALRALVCGGSGRLPNLCVKALETSEPALARYGAGFDATGVGKKHVH